jgi:protein-S-isoprenylcysteine O-methyltransferase Ste14
MFPYPVLNNPWFWIALYAIGLVIVLSVLGHKKGRNWATHKIPKPLLVAFMLTFIMLPPLALPFAEGPAIGLPTIVAVVAGGLLFAANIVVKIVSQRRIGAVPALKVKGRLVTDGIYGSVRHPLYMSNILMALGMALLMNSLVALGFSIFYFIGFGALIHFEEIGLVEQYGDRYISYRQQVPWKMIPMVF